MASTVAAPAIRAQGNAPIRIGFINIFSGALAYTGEHALNGLNYYFDQIGWTVAGRKIEVIREDDQANPQVGLQKARKFIESDKVDVIIGPQATNVALAIMNFVKQTKSFILPISGADFLTQERLPYLFRPTYSATQVVLPMGRWVHDTVAPEAVIFGSDFAGSRQVLDMFKQAYTAAGGKIVAEMYAPLGTNDFSVYLVEIKRLAPKVVFDWFGGTDAVRYVQQFAEAGLKEKIRLTGFAALIDSATIAAQGRAALGAVTSNIYTDRLDNPENHAFVAGFRERYKDWPNLYTDSGYMAARILAEALKGTDGNVADKDALSAAMAKVAFAAPRGPFRFDPVTHNPIQDVYILEVQEADGRFVNEPITTIKDVRDPGIKPG